MSDSALVTLDVLPQNHMILSLHLQQKLSVLQFQESEVHSFSGWLILMLTEQDLGVLHGPYTSWYSTYSAPNIYYVKLENIAIRNEGITINTIPVTTRVLWISYFVHMVMMMVT